jgi:ATP phosphoribosyltransferase regulatory subunit
MNTEPPVPAGVLAAIRAPFAGIDGTRVDPAVIQPLNLLLDLAGEAMRARLFVVQDEGGREACLRPDFTVAIVRDHVRAGGGEGLYLYEGKAFRVAAPGAPEGHPEEFVQVGLEAFTEADAPYDMSEIPLLAWWSARAGGRDDLSLHIGDVGLFRAFLSDIGVEPALAARLQRLLTQSGELDAELARAQAPVKRPAHPLAATLSNLPRDEAVGRLEAFWAENDLPRVGGRDAAEIVERLHRRAEAACAAPLGADQAGLIARYLEIAGPLEDAVGQVRALAGGPALLAKLADWEALPASLATGGVPLDRAYFSSRIASPFSYYDDFLFDITSDALGPLRPVASGGRYDALLAQVGGGGLRAVGCMVRPARAWIGGCA